MKKMLLGLVLSSTIFAEVHPAKITSIKKVGEDGASRTFEVTYLRKETERVLGASVTMLPMPFVTEHTHHMVSIILEGEPSETEKSVVEIKQVKVERGDVVDQVPVLLQPAVFYSCQIFSGIPLPEDHCKDGTTKELCNAISGCKWLPSDYAGPYPPSPHP